MTDEDIIIVNECECGCGCGEVELHSDKEPEVLLFDEYVEPYENDIVRAREAAENTLVYVQEKHNEIIDKENLLLDDHQTIKRELRKGFVDVLGSIATEAKSVRDKVVENAASIRELMRDKADALHNDLEVLKDRMFEECTEEEVYDIFAEVPPHEPDFDDVTIEDGYMDLEGFENISELTPYYEEEPWHIIGFDDIPIVDGYMYIEDFLQVVELTVNEN